MYSGAEPVRSQTKIEVHAMRKKISGLICATALCVFAGSAMADPAKDQRENEYKAAVAHADADYSAAKQACSTQKGNDKDVCIKDAKAAHVQATADAKARRKSNAAMADARDDKMTANYNAAKERCDSLSGDAKDACVKDAKLKYHQ
jgi:hypothetical protein